MLKKQTPKKALQGASTLWRLCERPRSYSCVTLSLPDLLCAVPVGAGILTGITCAAASDLLSISPGGDQLSRPTRSSVPSLVVRQNVGSPAVPFPL